MEDPGLGIIEEQYLNKIVDYALEYPSMVLSYSAKDANTYHNSSYLIGTFIGFISGIFFDSFLKRNKRFLNNDEMLHFQSVVSSRMEEIKRLTAARERANAA